MNKNICSEGTDFMCFISSRVKNIAGKKSWSSLVSEFRESVKFAERAMPRFIL